MNVENCWILPGGTQGRLWWGYLRRHTTGSICEVAFDAAYVLKREEDRGDIIGFYHTHPCGAFPSDRDDRTMKQWVFCFGKPLACVIQGTDDTRVWWYMDDENPPVLGKTVKVFGGLIVGIMPKKPEKPRFDPVVGHIITEEIDQEVLADVAEVAKDCEIPGSNEFLEQLL